MNRRLLLLVVAAGALLLLGASQSYLYMVGQRDMARQTESDASICREAAARIAHLSERPVLAAEREEGDSQLAGLIEKASQGAGVAATSIVSIHPGPPQPIADSSYKEKATQLTLHGVTLEQLVKMVYTLLSSSSQLHVKSITISAPRDDVDNKTWAAEVTLTYLIYDPAQGRR